MAVGFRALGVAGVVFRALGVAGVVFGGQQAGPKVLRSGYVAQRPAVCMCICICICKRIRICISMNMYVCMSYKTYKLVAVGFSGVGVAGVVFKALGVAGVVFGGYKRGTRGIWMVAGP